MPNVKEAAYWGGFFHVGAARSSKLEAVCL